MANGFNPSLSSARGALLAIVAPPSMHLAVEQLRILVNTVKSVHAHKEAWTHFIEEVAQVVLAAGGKVDDTNSLSPGTLDHIKELEGILLKAKATLTRIQSQNFFSLLKSFFIKDGSVLREINEYSDSVGRVRQFFEQMPSPSAVPLQPAHISPPPPRGPPWTINFIPGDVVINNISQVTNNIRSHRVTTVNTIDAHNVHNVAGRNELYRPPYFRKVPPWSTLVLFTHLCVWRELMPTSCLPSLIMDHWSQQRFYPVLPTSILSNEGSARLIIV